MDVKRNATLSKSVFVVDDDPAVCRALVRLLRSSGYMVESFLSAEGFLNVAGARLPDCLLLDIQMPGMDGFALQAKLTESGIQLPVIVVTSLGGSSTREAALKAGAVDCLEKPVSAKVLLDAVGRVTAPA